MRELSIYTDGSSLGNPGKGGWGVILMGNNQVSELGGYQKDATNNQMEMMAVYKALEEVGELAIRGYVITIYSDSAYVINGITDWIHGWKKKNWKKSDGKAVLNKDIWEDLDRIRDLVEADNKLFFEHVKAHNGHTQNERVDEIARTIAEKHKMDLYAGPLKDYQFKD